MEHSNMHEHHHHHEKKELSKKEEHVHHKDDMKHNPPMGHAGNDHHAMMINDFRKRFYDVLILTVPIMLRSPGIHHWLNVQW